MAVTPTPVFTQTPQHSSTAVATANTNLDGTGTIATGPTIGSNGARILTITIIAKETTSAGSIQIFVDLTGGANSWQLFDSHVVGAITVTAGTAPFRKAISYENFLLPAGAQIGFSTYVTDTFECHVDYGDF